MLKGESVDFKQIKELVEILEQSGLTKLTIKEKSGQEITLEKERSSPHVHEGHQQHAKVHIPVPSHSHESGLHKTSDAEVIDEKKCVKSPMVGTFYRAESPDKQSFKEVGDEVNVGDVVCIIEAMKVMNEIKSSIKGKVKKVLVDNASPVEYGQKLFIIE